MQKSKILVLCTGNSCRSQMAHGWIMHAAQLLKIDLDVVSAGVETHGLNSKAVEVMKEVGIDISQHTSNLIEEYLGSGISHAITVCDHAAEKCPVFTENVKKTHHNFSDPSNPEYNPKNEIPAYRKTRNEIRDFVFSYLQNL